eukprot:2971848-Prymnesium_polylepis.1
MRDPNTVRATTSPAAQDYLPVPQISTRVRRSLEGVKDVVLRTYEAGPLVETRFPGTSSRSRTASSSPLREL